MYQQGGGYSLYGQNMRVNPYQNPNNNNNNRMPNNYYQNNNNNYNNNYNGSNPQYQNKINGYQNNSNNNNINININKHKNNNKIMNTGQKYADLELNVHFRNENNNMNLSAKDLETKNELEIITNQFRDIINNINELSGKGPKSFDESNQLNKIKQELNQIESQSGNAYSIFIGELYEVSKNDQVLNLTYDNYKKDQKKTNEEIKKIISEFKYDIVKFKNKDNSKENIKKINNYIDKKTKKAPPPPPINNSNSNNNNYNNNGMNKNNSNFNYISNNFNDNNFNDFKIHNNNSVQKQSSEKFSIFDDNDFNQGANDNQRSNSNFNINSIYNNNNNNKINYNGNNSIYNVGNNNNNNYNGNNNTYSSGSNSIYSQNKPKYEDPNDISDYTNYNFDNNSNKKNEKIKVQFSFDGKETFHDIDPTESAEVLQVCAMEEKDDPKIYTIDGRHLSYDVLLNNKVGDIFKNCQPILNVY